MYVFIIAPATVKSVKIVINAPVWFVSYKLIIPNIIAAIYISFPKKNEHISQIILITIPNILSALLL